MPKLLLIWISDSYKPLVECVPKKNFFSYLSAKTYVVGTQKNHLNETVLLSIQNIR